MKAQRIFDTTAEASKGPTVVKPFATENRRFKAGDPITRDDLKGSSRGFDHMVEREFISRDQADK